MAVYGPAEPDEFYGYGSAQEMRESMAETTAFNEKLQAQGYWVFADGLESAAMAKVVDGQGPEPVLDRRPLPGVEGAHRRLWIIDVPDLDVALALAAEASRACRGKVEVRPFQTELS